MGGVGDAGVELEARRRRGMHRRGDGASHEWKRHRADPVPLLDESVSPLWGGHPKGVALAHHGVGVCALERKGADPRRLALKLVRCGVSVRSTGKHHRSHHPRGVDGGGDVRVDTPEVHHTRDELTAQGAGGVHEPSRARRTLGVTDVGLDGTEHERVKVRGSARSGAQDPEEATDLDRVSERSPGAVHLEAHHVTGCDPAVAQGAGDDVLLGGAVGGGEGA